MRISHLVVFLSLACACGDPAPSKYPEQQVHVEDTTLGPGDLFDVRVFGQEGMSATYSVSNEGAISFPLIGSVEVGGKTPAAVERDIRERLADGYLRDPQVSVLVREYKSKKISVFGQVRKPGTFGYTDGMTVVEAIAQAGGFNEMARKNAVTVTRKHDDKQTKYTVPVESIGEGKAENFFIRPGDVVFVPRRLW
jgi:polysaccharide export outer membrane protein